MKPATNSEKKKTVLMNIEVPKIKIFDPVVPLLSVNCQSLKQVILLKMTSIKKTSCQTHTK